MDPLDFPSSASSAALRHPADRAGWLEPVRSARPGAGTAADIRGAAAPCPLVGHWLIVDPGRRDGSAEDRRRHGSLLIEAGGVGVIAIGGTLRRLWIDFSGSIVFFRWSDGDATDTAVGSGSAELQDDGAILIEFAGHPAILRAVRQLPARAS